MYHKDLEIWKLSIKFVKEIYLVTENFPKSELYGLTSQLRRTAISIPSNLAEGNARFSDKETLRFIDITIGSIAEIDTQLTIAKEIGFLTHEQTIKLIENLSKINAMAIGLRKSLKNKQTDINEICE